MLQWLHAYFLNFQGSCGDVISPYSLLETAPIYLSEAFGLRVGIFIITFGNMLRIRIGKVWQYTIILLLKQTDKIPTTTKKSTQNQPKPA